MRHAFAIVLLCVPALLSARERCEKPRANRVEIARPLSTKPHASRVEVTRRQKIGPLLAWQRAVLFEQQIL